MLAFVHKISAILASVVVFVGISVLGGWMFDIVLLKSIIPGVVSMNPLTALSFILGGIAVLFLVKKWRGFNTVVLVTGLLMFTFGAARMLGILNIYDLHLDQVLFHRTLLAVTNFSKNRIAPNTSLNLMLLGISLTLISFKRFYKVAQSLASVTFIIAFFAILGYWYSVKNLYGFLSYTPMALNTAIEFCLLSFAIICSMPAVGITRLLSSESAGGVLLRRVLPWIILIPSCFGWIRLMGQVRGYYGYEYGTALLVAFIVLFFLFLIFQIASRLDRVDSARLEVLEIVERQKSQNEAILSGIGDAVFAIDINKKIILYNQAAEDITGYTELEAMGKFYGDLLIFTKEKDKTIQNNFIDLALSGKKAAMTNHTVLQDKQGKTIPVADSAAPFYGSKGDILGAVVVFRDVSSERIIEQAKSDFVSLTSHQLKTPIAQIKGYIANMIDGLTGELNPKQKEYLSDMLQVANSNSALIDDLLNVSRIERGIIKFEPEKTDLIEIVKRAASPLRNVAADKKVLFTEAYLDKPLIVWADTNKTIEALRNIMDNALKFTNPDKTVSIEVKEINSTPTVIIIDEGPGIDPDVQTELFEKNRVWSGKVKASGAGLGLYLSKQFIELQGGTISYETASGKGTTFIIKFKSNV